ncbi:MAG TPA: hypothetical protein VFQ12_05715 [Thermoleophilaceae bacterium]|nr:hypothetical protein [Thermoleophilaceae bacterium]
MSGFWAVFWLAVVLKLPIGALLYIVWWAAKEPPLPEPEDGGGGAPRRDGPHPRLRPPHPPRRGPHADPVPVAPSRVRAGSGRPRRPAEPHRLG